MGDMCGELGVTILCEPADELEVRSVFQSAIAARELGRLGTDDAWTD
jgi:hypothetical protein